MANYYHGRDNMSFDMELEDLDNQDRSKKNDRLTDLWQEHKQPEDLNDHDSNYWKPVIKPAWNGCSESNSPRLRIKSDALQNRANIQTCPADLYVIENDYKWDPAKKNFTIRHAKNLACVLKLVQPDVQPSEVVYPRNEHWNRLKRQCWAKECWSEGKHSHVSEKYFQQSDRSRWKKPEVEAQCCALCKQKCIKVSKKFKSSFVEFWKNLDPWRSSFKKIEGQYGTAVVSYFIFIKQILLLNFFIFTIILICIILPQIYFKDDHPSNVTSYDCSKSKMQNSISEKYNTQNSSLDQKFLDFFLGTGWLEETYLFYGAYSYRNLSSSVLENTKNIQSYNLPLAYILTTFSYFFISLIIMVGISAQGLKERSSEIIGKKGHNYSNKIFAGWDFVIEDSNAAKIKHNYLFRELETDLMSERRAQQRLNLTFKEKLKLYFMRFFLNLLVVGILVLAGYSIYSGVEVSLKYHIDFQYNEDILSNFMKYLPSIIIVLLNLFVPFLFNKIVTYEDYSPAYEINITLGRTVFLRLASISVLLVVVYFQINPQSDIIDVPKINNTNVNGLLCWETFVGQKIYQLTLLDFLVVVGSILLLDFPRKLIVTNFDNKLTKRIGLPEFIVPDHVLDVVYTQCLCWLGTLFCPFLPTITVLKCFIIFILKKYSLLKNYIPSQRAYKASRSSDFFLIVLLISFGLASFPVFYSIGLILPSRCCGPYRNHASMFSVITEMVSQWPTTIQIIISHLTSITFAFPLFVLLCLLLYYFGASSSANKHMISALKTQLVMDGKDKRFLLNEFQKLTKQQNQSIPTGGGDYPSSTSQQHKRFSMPNLESPTELYFQDNAKQLRSQPVLDYPNHSPRIIHHESLMAREYPKKTDNKSAASMKISPSKSEFNYGARAEAATPSYSTGHLETPFRTNSDHLPKSPENYRATRSAQNLEYMHSPPSNSSISSPYRNGNGNIEKSDFKYDENSFHNSNL